MNKRVLIFLLSILMLATACIRENLPVNNSVPEGSPVTLTIPFGATTPVEVNVGTKAEATEADESRVHDLYVMIFDNAADGKPRTYGRYFNYEHRWQDKAKLNDDTNENEGWYVQNKTMSGASNPVEKTLGAVKIATVAHANCTLVLLANVDNSLVSLDGQDPLTALNAVTNLSELRDLPVHLEQNVVERNDLFLMAGEIDNLDMTKVDGSDNPDMTWYRDKDGEPSTDGFGNKYRVTLSPIDAKVKFRIRANETNISSLTPVKWTVFNVPTSCYLFPTNPETGRTGYVYPPGDVHYYFDMDPVYFDTEETETVGGQTVKWHTFTFYMLESCLPSSAITNPSDKASYYLRDKRSSSGGWEYAPEKAPYVTFTLSMTLTDAGINDLDNLGPDSSKWENPNNQKPIGATGEMTYTVHLGDFAHPDPNDANNTVRNANDYSTKRGYFYSYDITLNNAANLFAEVKYYQPEERIVVDNQPGQEGSLLLFSGGTVNCDAHYEYRMMEFKYSDFLATKLMEDPDYCIYSWYVKTPFNPNGAKPEWDKVTTHRFVADPTTMDYLWVKFAVNKLVNGEYSEERVAYPGGDAYDVSWYPGKEGAVPELLDINQLMNYIYYQHRLKKSGDPNNIFDASNLIRLTAFVDEYYYERDPFSGAVNPDLWRQFVNAEPREMYILSDVQLSQDEQSNLVNASHSIIQRSIQTIYNINSPDITSLWGLEHTDEIRQTKDWDGWDWGVGAIDKIKDYVKSEDNGRINSAALWGLYPAPDEDHDEWTDFLKYDVSNNIPELKDDAHRKMVYSCLTRNRDNNGNGFIDPEEVRWYMASINQLKGLWIGNESISASARVYQPWLTKSFSGNWRAHVLSSTCPDNSSAPKVLNAEEGTATFNYVPYNKPGTWVEGNAQDERRRESVRCVRNLGTYSVGGATLDISDAPYGLIPDNYFSVDENFDPAHSTDHNYSTYTIHFSRLDPRSLREFSNGELPFHDEKSSNNRVYLELHIQSRESRKNDPTYQDGAAIYGKENQSTALDAGDINEDITNSGYNKFCPAGYRLPNQKEMAMMSLALPSTYWQGSGTSRIPSRTYFSVGYYAAPGKQIKMEEIKLAWCYSTSNNKNDIFLPDRKSNRQVSDRIRCVRDNDMTGTILGNMYLSNNILMPGETTEINFNFTSSAASFKSGALYVCYRDTNGQPVETQIPLNRQPNGMQYITTQSFVAPDPASLNPSPGDRPTAMTLKLVLKNTKDETEYVFEEPFTIAAVDIHCDFELLPGSDKTLGFPIHVQVGASNGAKIQGLRLLMRTTTGGWMTLQDQTTGFAEAVGRIEYGTTVYFKPSQMPATYFFKLEAVSNSASENKYTASPKSMEFVVEKDFMPNPDGSYEDPINQTGAYHKWTEPWWQTFSNASGWLAKLVGHVETEYVGKEQKYVIRNTWRKEIQDLNFPAGDFIEADMDLMNCVAIRTTSEETPGAQDPGLDHILSFGRNPGWDETGSLHVYYPANDPSMGINNELRFYAVSSTYGYTTIGRVHSYNGERPMLLRFDQDGITYNSMALKWKAADPNPKKQAEKQAVDEARYNTVVKTLTGSKSLYVGSEVDPHLSRAKYKYLRVVRVDLGNGSFIDDPQYGGNL